MVSSDTSFGWHGLCVGVEKDALREHVAVLSGRAQKKWDELDVDGSDELDGEEVLMLAEWVWSSFHPGGEPLHRGRPALPSTCGRSCRHPCARNDPVAD